MAETTACAPWCGQDCDAADDAMHIALMAEDWAAAHDLFDDEKARADRATDLLASALTENERLRSALAPLVLVFDAVDEGTGWGHGGIIEAGVLERARAALEPSHD